MRHRLTCALAFAVAAATAHGATPAVSDGVVKIGVLTDLSGPYSAVGGPGSVLAARMAIEDSQRERAAPFRVELVSADHQNKPDVGAAKAREWYDTQQVDVIVDVINSGVALAVSQVTRDKRRVLLSTGAGSMRLTNEDCSPNTISYTWDTYSISRPQVTALTREGRDSWFFVTVDYALGQSIEQDARAAIQAAGGTVVGAVKHPLNASDFSSFVLQAQASKAKAVAIANGGGDLVNAIKAAREFGLMGAPSGGPSRGATIVPLTATITDVHAMGLDLAQGLLLTEAFYWNRDAQTRAWSRRFFESQKRMPNAIHAGTYSAVLTYLRAVRDTGSDEAATVLARMRQVRIDDVFARDGHVREDGRMIKEMYLMQVKTPARSTEPWDYYEIKSVIPAAAAFQPLSESRCPLLKKS